MARQGHPRLKGGKLQKTGLHNPVRVARSTVSIVFLQQWRTITPEPVISRGLPGTVPAPLWAIAVDCVQWRVQTKHIRACEDTPEAYLMGNGNAGHNVVKKRILPSRSVCAYVSVLYLCFWFFSCGSVWVQFYRYFKALVTFMCLYECQFMCIYFLFPPYMAETNSHDEVMKSVWHFLMIKPQMNCLWCFYKCVFLLHRGACVRACVFVRVFGGG